MKTRAMNHPLFFPPLLAAVTLGSFLQAQPAFEEPDFTKKAAPKELPSSPNNRGEFLPKKTIEDHVWSLIKAKGAIENGIWTTEKYEFSGLTGSRRQGKHEDKFYLQVPFDNFEVTVNEIQLSEADKLNGIDWKAHASASFTTVREGVSKDPHQIINWTDWKSRRYTLGEFQAESRKGVITWRQSNKPPNARDTGELLFEYGIPVIDDEPVAAKIVEPEAAKVVEPLAAKIDVASNPLPEDIPDLVALSDEGNNRAMAALARRYWTGTGVPKDEAKAASLLAKLAETETWAAHNLACILFLNHERDKAIAIFSLGAEKGFGPSMFVLGWYFVSEKIDSNRGWFHRNFYSALAWSKKAMSKEVPGAAYLYCLSAYARVLNPFWHEPGALRDLAQKEWRETALPLLQNLAAGRMGPPDPAAKKLLKEAKIIPKRGRKLGPPDEFLLFPYSILELQWPSPE